MDLRIMEYYLAVTREGNISAAAEALHISQPALSDQGPGGGAGGHAL